MDKKLMVCLCLLSVSLMMLVIGCKPSGELPPGPEDMESLSESAPLGLATGYQVVAGAPAECYPDAKARPASDVQGALTITSSDDNPVTTRVIEVNGNDLLHVNVRIKDDDLVWVPVKVGKGTATGRIWETLALVDSAGSPLNFHSKNKYGGAGCVSTHIGETCTDTCQDGLQCRGQTGNKKCFPKSGTQCWAAAGSNDVTLPLSAFNIQPSDFRDCTLPGAPNPVKAVVLAGYTGAAAQGRKWLVQVIAQTGTGGVGDGGPCQQTPDCQSGLECISGICRQPPPHCGDTATKCGYGDGCRGPNDCQSGVCENGQCATALTQEAPEEFDIDDASSGGGGDSTTHCGDTSAKCADGQECRPQNDPQNANADCQSGSTCDTSQSPAKCVAATSGGGGGGVQLQSCTTSNAKRCGSQGSGALETCTQQADNSLKWQPAMCGTNRGCIDVDGAECVATENSCTPGPMFDTGNCDGTSIKACANNNQQATTSRGCGLARECMNGACAIAD